MTDNSIEMTSPKVARTGSRAPLSVVSSLTSTPSDALAPAAQMGVRRRTLKSAIDCTGIGLHGGKKIHMTLRPADAGTGIVFRRADLFGPDGSVPAKAIIPGRYDSVADCRMCTTIANASGTTISTVEHLMAALAGNGIDDLIVDVSGPEIPVMDGSSGPFLFLIDCAGVIEHAAPRRAIKVLKPVIVTDGAVTAALYPADRGFSIDFEIEFGAAAIGQQSCHFDVTSGLFRDEISRARTFGFLEDVTRMREAGLALGGSLDNAVVVDGDRVLNDGGLRYDTEFVRHKALDALGDMYMAGAPLIAAYHGVRSSHHHNNQLLRKLFADDSAWCYQSGVAMADLQARRPDFNCSSAQSGTRYAQGAQS